MNPIQYRYSKAASYQVLFAIFLMLIAFPIGMIIENSTDQATWLIFILVIFVGLAAIYYWYQRLYTHIVKKDIALEMDSEKLSYFIRHKVIYWKDVANIEYDISRNGNYTIRFNSNSDAPDQTIRTNFVDGNDKAVYNTIVSYFDKYGPLAL